MPEWGKDALAVGPVGAMLLYETWSPLFKVVEYWREGALEHAIPLTIVAVVLAVAAICAATVVVRNLRHKFRLWLPRLGTKND